MKNLRYLLFLAIAFQASQIQSVAPTAAEIFNYYKNLDLELSSILINDNLAALENFITANPNYGLYENHMFLPWPTESQSPLSAAVWFGAVNCVQHLLTYLPAADIQATINMKSSHGFTPLHYAQHPPSNKQYQAPFLPTKVHRPTLANYKEIATMLKQHGATA